MEYDSHTDLGRKQIITANAKVQMRSIYLTTYYMAAAFSRPVLNMPVSLVLISSPCATCK